LRSALWRDKRAGFEDADVMGWCMKTPSRIVGKKITLKKLQESFFEEYHQQFSPAIRQPLHLPLVASFHETCDFLKKQIALIAEGRSIFFCIFDNHDKKLIGALEVREPSHIHGQLGAWVNEHYWGGGRYQEALKFVLDLYFEQTNNPEIFIFVDSDNIRSVKAHEKVGFKIVDTFVMNSRESCCFGKTLYRMVCQRHDVLHCEKRLL